jgi:hypothetical protein
LKTLAQLDFIRPPQLEYHCFNGQLVSLRLRQRDFIDILPHRGTPLLLLQDKKDYDKKEHEKKDKYEKKEDKYEKKEDKYEKKEEHKYEKDSKYESKYDDKKDYDKYSKDNK